MSKADCLIEYVADDVGVGLGLGTVGGFAYHLVKGLRLELGRHSHSHSHSHSYGTVLRLACQKAPYVGVTGALFGAASSIMLIVDWSIREKNGLYTRFISYGFAGAAVYAKRGFRSASLPALSFALRTICVRRRRLT